MRVQRAHGEADVRGRTERRCGAFFVFSFSSSLRSRAAAAISINARVRTRGAAASAFPRDDDDDDDDKDEFGTKHTQKPSSERKDCTLRARYGVVLLLSARCHQRRKRERERARVLEERSRLVVSSWGPFFFFFVPLLSLLLKNRRRKKYSSLSRTFTRN